MEKISRSNAKARNLPRYFMGTRCLNGNVSERSVSGGYCLCEPCVQAEKERQKRWREANREISLAGKRRYYEANKEAELEKRRAYRVANLEAVKATQAAYRAAPEKRADAIKRFNLHRQQHPEKHTREVVLARPSKAPEKQREYRQNSKMKNPHLSRLASAHRRAARNQRTPPWFGEFDALVFEEAATLAVMRKACTGFNWHIDHMIALRGKRASGMHCGANAQVIPEWLNLRKHNRLWLTEPGEWISHA